MRRVIQAGAFLAVAAFGVCLLLLVAGLAIAARPEMAAVFGPGLGPKTGLVMALAGGIGALGCAVLLHVLDLLRGDLGDDDGPAIP